MRIQIGECTFDSVRREVRRGARAVASLAEGLRAARRPARAPAARARRKDELFERALAEHVRDRGEPRGARRRDPARDRRRRARAPVPAHRARVRVRVFGGRSRRGGGRGRHLPARSGACARSRSGDGENVLGREPAAAVFIDDATVSRHHARIVIDRGRAVLEDLGSKNGTWLRGHPDRRVARPLVDGDEIRIGSVPMTFRCFAAERPDRDPSGLVRRPRAVPRKRALHQRPGPRSSS